MKYSKAIEWLGNYDLLSNGMRSEREYGLMGYLPYMVVPFYPLFQERGSQKVERPKVDWEVRRMYASEEMTMLISFAELYQDEGARGDLQILLEMPQECLRTGSWMFQAPHERTDPTARVVPIYQPYHFPTVTPCKWLS